MSTKGLKWGIVATGGICRKFVRDLLVDPTRRGVSDIDHIVQGVGSRSVESAQKFIDDIKQASASDPWQWGVENGKLDGCKAYGSYEDLYADPDINIIYVGTPHTLHYRNTKDALLAGKNVLCEKPFTMNAEELEELTSIAKEKNLFLMEAVWTRFLPVAYAVEELLRSGELGRPRRLLTDFSMDFRPDNMPLTSRMIDPALGGGSLLDMGPYPSVWGMLLAHRHPLNTDDNPKILNVHQTVYERTGVDLTSRWLVEWKGLCQASMTTDMGSAGLRDATAILQCQEGDLFIHYPPYRTETFSIVPRPTQNIGSVTEQTVHPHPIHDGYWGMIYEADECARCISKGKIESNRMPWAESKIVQQWLDEVRERGGLATDAIKQP